MNHNDLHVVQIYFKIDDFCKEINHLIEKSVLSNMEKTSNQKEQTLLK